MFVEERRRSVRLKRGVECRGGFVAQESGRVPVVNFDESFDRAQRGHDVTRLFC